MTSEFHSWLNLRRLEWQQFKAVEGSLLTFNEYLNARSLFLKEKDRG